MNVHLSDVVNRQRFLAAIKQGTNLSVCGVVESWLKNGSAVMAGELLGSEWKWYGKDRKGRVGGGVGVLVKSELSPKLLSSKNENLLWVELGSGLVYIAVVYLLPKDRKKVNEAVLDELEAGVLKWSAKGRVVVLGDFNARLGRLPNRVYDPEDKVVDLVEIKRESVDRTVDAAGRRLLERMNALGLVLLNGTSGKAEWTSFQYNGEAVVDFAWVHVNHWREVKEFKVWENFHLDLGDHALVSAAIVLKNLDWPSSRIQLPEGHQKESKVARWNTRKGDWGRMAKVAQQVLTGWDPQVVGWEEGSNEDKVEVVWKDWCARVSHAAESGIGRRVPSKPKPWGWDRELARIVQERNRVKKARVKSEGETRDRLNEELRHAQARLKKRLKDVRTQNITRRNQLLEESRTANARVYWSTLKKVVGLGKRKHEIPSEAIYEGWSVQGARVKEVWQQAWQKLATVDENDEAFDKIFMANIRSRVKQLEESSWLDMGIDEEINEPIQPEEVVLAVKSLRNNKAAGIDGMVNEILKLGGDEVTTATWKLCEEMFRLERIPRDWARGLIFPLYKDGDPRSPDNYRGITLLSVVGKTYATVINNRIKKWCEERDVLVDEQAGFRVGRSTVDHVFLLSEVLRARKKKGRQTFCSFLDIRKAYDCVFREGLWLRLGQIGLHGKMWRVLRNLYAVVESCVLVGADRTEFFSIDAGLRQGCILSPILFAIFIDGLAREIKAAKTKPTIGKLRINVLLFADDLVLIADSQKELQYLLDIAFNYSRKWRFHFNVAKSKVMVVKGRKAEQGSGALFLGLQKLERVDLFKYLGIDFTCNLSWKATKCRLAGKAKAKLAIVSKAIIEGISLETAETLWVSLIRPTLEYGAEVWGRGAWLPAEQLQREVGRKILGVGSKTCNEAITGELGWMSMKSRRDVARLRFWWKLVNLKDDKLLKQVYSVCKPVLENDRSSWFYGIRELLKELKLAHVWTSEATGSRKDWLVLVNGCIKRREKDSWMSGMEAKSKLRLYRVLKSRWGKEEYLNLPTEQRSLITELRCGTSRLRVELGRWRQEQREDRVCVLCDSYEVEDERHVLLKCPVYANQRAGFFEGFRGLVGYDLHRMEGEEEWMTQAIIGCSLGNKVARLTGYALVASFIKTVFRVREKRLKKVREMRELWRLQPLPI